MSRGRLRGRALVALVVGSFAVASLALASLPGAVAAQAAAPPGVTVTDGWMRALPDLPASGYFSLHNGGTATVVLTGASSSSCGTLTLHQTIRMRTMSRMHGPAPGSMPGMTSMRPVEAIPVPAGGTVSFTPGGYHLMCGQPGPAVSPGATIPVTLRFAGGGSLTAPFAVRRPGGG